MRGWSVSALSMRHRSGVSYRYSWFRARKAYANYVWDWGDTTPTSLNPMLLRQRARYIPFSFR